MFRELLVWFLNHFEKVKQPMPVFAHCDIPCGVYETDSMMHAVETVKSLTKKIMDLETPDDDDSQAMMEYTHTLSRMTEVKEEYAQICKDEVLILWTDKFNESHLKDYPKLHEKVWKVTKLCSQVKRELSMEKVKELEKAASEVAKIFKNITS